MGLIWCPYPLMIWIAAFRDRAQPEFVGDNHVGALFLNNLGNPLKPSHLTMLVKHYVTKSAIGKEGACYLFRHTMATLMLENSAETRYIQAILGTPAMKTVRRVVIFVPW